MFTITSQNAWLWNYFTVCGLICELFRRNMKNWIQWIYENESNVLPKRFFCAVTCYGTWPKLRTFWWIFRQNTSFAQSFQNKWPKTKDFSTDKCEQCIWIDVCEWHKLQTFSQKGAKWTEIDLCEWVLYFAKRHALCHHFTAISPNCRLFRRKARMVINLSMQMSPIFCETYAKNGLKSIYSMRMSPIFCQTSGPKPRTFPQTNVKNAF